MPNFEWIKKRLGLGRKTRKRLTPYTTTDFSRALATTYRGKIQETGRRAPLGGAPIALAREREKGNRNKWTKAGYTLINAPMGHPSRKKALKILSRTNPRELYNNLRREGYSEKQLRAFARVSSRMPQLQGYFNIVPQIHMAKMNEPRGPGGTPLPQWMWEPLARRSVARYKRNLLDWQKAQRMARRPQYKNILQRLMNFLRGRGLAQNIAGRVRQQNIRQFGGRGWS